MRIISGHLGGRIFEAPRGHRTHPMSENMRGALFNALGDIDGLSVLDGFGGSGALSFEAISRGAAYALVIEQDKHAQQTIEDSIQKLGVKAQVKAVRANASGWSDNNVAKLFDIVLLDPPYDAIKVQLIEKLANHVAPNGILVLSLPKDFTMPALSGFTQLQINQHGDGLLAFYKKSS